MHAHATTDRPLIRGFLPNILHATAPINHCMHACTIDRSIAFGSVLLSLGYSPRGTRRQPPGVRASSGRTPRGSFGRGRIARNTQGLQQAHCARRRMFCRLTLLHFQQGVWVFEYTHTSPVNVRLKRPPSNPHTRPVRKTRNVEDACRSRGTIARTLPGASHPQKTIKLEPGRGSSVGGAPALLQKHIDRSI